MRSPPLPDAHQLLPPLLACLPAAFVSARPPPALLPLLAPVLRQRVNYLSGSSAGAREGWLPLLSWDSRMSSRLPAVVEAMQIEPHPVSGEIELEGLGQTKYHRLDPETLHARLPIEQFGLLPTYVWCENDEHGGTGPGWKLADLRSLDDWDDQAAWRDSIAVANDMHQQYEHSQSHASSANGIPASNDDAEDGDDDDYWAAYDREPSQTPANNTSRAPNTGSNAGRDRSQSELEYFSRYGDVQPAMDTHDPDEVEASAMGMGESSLQGDMLVRQLARAAHQGGPQHAAVNDGQGVSAPPMFPGAPSTQQTNMQVSMPRPLSPVSSTHSSVDKLEREAARMDDQGDEHAQIGVKQHISTDIKSLYRLAKSVGISRDDFTDMVTRELEVLSIFDQDD